MTDQWCLPVLWLLPVPWPWLHRLHIWEGGLFLLQEWECDGITVMVNKWTPFAILRPSVSSRFMPLTQMTSLPASASAGPTMPAPGSPTQGNWTSGENKCRSSLKICMTRCPCKNYIPLTILFTFRKLKYSFLEVCCWRTAPALGNSTIQCPPQNTAQAQQMVAKFFYVLDVWLILAAAITRAQQKMWSLYGGK